MRTTLAAVLTSVVYAAFGTIVWSAYDQFGRPSWRDVTPLVKTRAAFVKLAPPRLSVRGFEADRPPDVATLEPWATGGELPPQSATAQVQDRGAGPPEPAALSTPPPARSIARAAAVGRPAPPPEETAPGRPFAQAEARLQAGGHPGAGQLGEGSVAPSGTPPAAGAVGGPSAPPLAAGRIASTSPAPSRVPAQPEVTTPLPPLPLLKPYDVMIARTSTDPALSSRGGGRTTAVAAVSGANARTPPPPPAFKPLEGERILASGERLRTAPAGTPSDLRSFWSSLMALFTAAPRRLLIADNGGAREAGFDRSGAGNVADQPGRAGGDPAGQSAGSSPGGGTGTDSDKPGGGNPAGKSTNGGGRGDSVGSAASSRDRGADRGRSGRGGRGDDDDGGGRGRGGDNDGGGRGNSDGDRGRGGDDDDDDDD